MKQKVKPTRVLCGGPFGPSERAYFRVEVEPREVVGRPITFTMSGSCFWHSYPPHKLAWAAGYKVLRMVSDAGFRPLPGKSSVSLEIQGFTTGPSSMPANQQIEDAIHEAESNSRAWQEVNCPACSKPFVLPGGSLQMDSAPPIEQGQVVSVQCSCRHEIVVTSEELHFLR